MLGPHCFSSSLYHITSPLLHLHPRRHRSTGSPKKSLYLTMTQHSTINAPYICGTRAGEDVDGENFYLDPNCAYNVAHDFRGDLTLFFDGTKGITPTITEAMQLNHKPHVPKHDWFGVTEFSLVTGDGKRDLPLGSHFITDAKNNVISPNQEAPSCELDLPSSSHLNSKPPTNSSEIVPESRE